MRTITVLTILVCAVSAGVTVPESRDLVRITNASRNDVRAIEQFGVWVNDVKPDGVVAEATRLQQQALGSAGFTVEVITPDITGIYEANFRSGADFGVYLTYLQFVDTMRTIAQNNPHICKLETLGLSHGGRQILAMKFSDNPHEHENEPALHFEGAIHGDEKIAWAVCFEMIKYLASRYGSDTLVTRLINTRETWLVPLYNPDGYNASPASRYNARSVDLNRNWGWMWGNEAAMGASPFSENENKAVLAHIWRHPFVTFVSYHSGTLFISHPWSYCYSYQNTIPELPMIQFLSARYDAHTNYTYGQGADSMYIINGSTKDFDYGYGMMGWSIEVHLTKTPPASEIDPTFNKNRPAILEFMHHAGKGIHGTVTDASSGRPVPAQIWVNPANWPSYNDTTLGDFHRFYLPGTYSVTFRAPGYRDTTISGVVVPAAGDSSVTLHVQMNEDLSKPLFAFRHVFNSFVTPSSNRTYPVRALGPSDGVAFQLDNGKTICLDMLRPVRNQTGPDMVVYRSSGTGTASVAGSHSWEGPWTTIGAANSPQTSFDIGAAGLDSVRFVRLTASGTFNFDAIEGANYTGIAGPQPVVPTRFDLTVNRNPARGTVRFSISRPADPGMRLDIRDAAGRLARALPFTGHELVWHAGLPAGVYFCSLSGRTEPALRLALTK